MRAVPLMRILLFYVLQIVFCSSTSRTHPTALTRLDTPLLALKSGKISHSAASLWTNNLAPACPPETRQRWRPVSVSQDARRSRRLRSSPSAPQDARGIKSWRRFTRRRRKAPRRKPALQGGWRRGKLKLILLPPPDVLRSTRLHLPPPGFVAVWWPRFLLLILRLLFKRS